jgi:hypothetical protein
MNIQLLIKRISKLSVIGSALALSSPSMASLLTYEWVTVTNPSIAPFTSPGFITTFEVLGSTSGTLQIEDSLVAGSYLFDSRQPPFTNLTTLSTPRSAVSSIYSLSFTANYSVYRSDTNAQGAVVRTFAGEQAAVANLAPLNFALTSDFSFANYFATVGTFTRYATASLIVGADNTLSLTGRIGESLGSDPVYTEFSATNGFTIVLNGGGPSITDSSPTGLSGFWRLAGTNAVPGGSVNPVSAPSSIVLIGLGLLFSALRKRPA